MPRLAVPDMEVVVVAGETGRQPLADEHRIVEVDELDVAWSGGADRLRECPGRRAVVRGHAPGATPAALVTRLAHDAEVDVEAEPVRLVAGDAAAVLERGVADGNAPVAGGVDDACRRLGRGDGRCRAPVRRTVLHR